VLSQTQAQPSGLISNMCRILGQIISACASHMVLAGNSNEKLKVLNMGQHILDSLDTPQQLYQVGPEVAICLQYLHRPHVV